MEQGELKRKEYHCLRLRTLFPGFQAFSGRIVSEDKIPIALGFIGLISGIGVSLNIAIIGVLLDLAWLYLASLMVLGVMLSVCLLRLTK